MGTLAVAELTKDELLARVATAYDMGLLTRERFGLMERWLDFVMRFEGGHMSQAVDFLRDEQERNHAPCSNMAIGTLAGDVDGYALIQFAAILTHHCQQCATDPSAWHTRSAFCRHREEEVARNG